MAYEGPFSSRILSNLVYIQETGVQFNAEQGVVDLDPIVLDATEHFSRDTRASVSDSPVADKSDRADHYRVYRPTFKIKGVISNDSISPVTWLTSLFSSKSRIQQVVERLDRIINEKRLVKVYMPDGLEAPNCLLSNLNVSRDKNQSNGFYITINAKQVQLIESQIASVPIAEDSDLLAEAKDGGDRAGPTASLKEANVIVPAQG